MKTLFTIILFLSPEIYACEFLEGKWKSDKAASMEYNNKIDRISESSMELFQQAFGIQELIYSKEALHLLPGPTIEVIVNEEKHPFYFEEIKKSITYTECSSERVVIDSEIKFGNDNTIYFDTRDSYWVSPFGTWREYFIRVK